MRKRLAIAALAVAPVLALVPASMAGTVRTVTIGDNFYSPAKMTIKPGTTVRWRWPDDTGDSHDVKLRSGPPGVRKFQSEEAGSAYSYKRRLTRVGTYRIICTLHDDMKQTIIVKR